MPLYEYECQECGIVFEEQLLIADRKAPIERPCFKCGTGEIQMILSSINLGDPVRLGITKPSAEFKDVMQKVKAGHPLAQFQRDTSTFNYDVSRRNEELEKTQKKIKDARNKG
jgi:putative FmdB family regulatory protein